MPLMSRQSPFTEAFAVRCTPELVAKLDELLVVLAAASPVAVQLNRSEVARAALVAGIEMLLATHRRAP
jgi:hypothetical protein